MPIFACAPLLFHNTTRRRIRQEQGGKERWTNGSENYVRLECQIAEREAMCCHHRTTAGDNWRILRTSFENWNGVICDVECCQEPATDRLVVEELGEIGSPPRITVVFCARHANATCQSQPAVTTWGEDEECVNEDFLRAGEWTTHRAF